MVRLGKRERAAKAAIIKGNLANMGNLERPTQVKRHKDGTLSVVSGSTMGSRMHSTNLLRHTHTMGAHVGHNNKGSSGGDGGYTRRFAGNDKTCDVARTVKVRDKTTGRMTTQQQVWLSSERVWKAKV